MLVLVIILPPEFLKTKKHLILLLLNKTEMPFCFDQFITLTMNV